MTEFLHGLAGQLVLRLLFIVLPIGLPLMIWHTVASRRRRARFAQRETLSPPEWFRRFMPQAQHLAQDLTEILRPLAREIGIDWAKLRPTDRFRVELVLPFPRNLSVDLEHFWDTLEVWCERRSLRLESPEQIDTLGDLLERIVAALRPTGSAEITYARRPHLSQGDS